MSTNNNTSCNCELCVRSKEIADIRKHKRQLSLGSIYKKDYRSSIQNLHHIALPQARKNQSTNIKGNKSFVQIKSTYLSNYKKSNPQSPIRLQQRKFSREQDILESYLSTYEQNYIKMPVINQQSYKISDPQFYKLNSPLSKITEYSKNYQASQKRKSSYRKKRSYNYQGSVRLFDTTQKQSYPNGKVAQNDKPSIPTNNMVTLPTSPFLYNTTYKKQYLLAPIKKQPDQHQHHFSDKYRF